MRVKITCLAVAMVLASAAASLAAEHFVPDMNGSDRKLMPAYLWYGGCAPTAAAMVMAYWDNYAQLGAANYGKNIKYGRLLDYYMDKTALDTMKGYFGNTLSWSIYGENIVKAKMHNRLAYYMKTNASGSTGSGDVPVGLTTVAVSMGYTDATSQGYNGILSNDYAWANLTAAIDSQKPCVWTNNSASGGHAVAAWGYTDSKYVIVYNTWDEIRHDFWYRYYNGTTGDFNIFTGVVTFDPGTMALDSDVELLSPDGGEALFTGVPAQIHWIQYGAGIERADLYYSEDGGLNWAPIASPLSSQGDNYFTWTPAAGIVSLRMRVKVEGWSGGGVLYGIDGSRLNFSCSVPANTFTITPTCTQNMSHTATGTPTRTNTFTITCTHTITKTSTESATITETHTPSDTFTITNTRTVTETWTVTQTGTMTCSNTPTGTFTDTFTNTPTFTATRTDTPTVTATCTVTQTGTPTATETGTPTLTATETGTETATSTATGTCTPTHTGTQTHTQTATPTFTGTDTSTRTVTKTGTATATGSPTDTDTATCTETLTYTLTVTLTKTYTYSETPTVTVTLTVSGTHTATITASETATFTLTATLTGTQTLTATATITATLTLTPSVTGTQTPQFTATATVELRSDKILKSAVVYPNPVFTGGSAVIAYELYQDIKTVKISMYTIGFRKIFTRKYTGSGSITAGRNMISINLFKDVSSGISAGSYYMVLEFTGSVLEERAIKQIMVLK